MPTIVESLTELASALRAALARWQDLFDQVSAKQAATVAQATTVINNFTNRAPNAIVWVDENNGLDAAGRGGETTPYRTVDYALDAIDRSVVNAIHMLSDCTMRRWHSVYSRVSFVGIARIPQANGYPYTFVRRKLSFLPEAANSPRADLGRVTPFFDMQDGAIATDFVDIVLPTAASGLNFTGLITTNGGQYSFSNGTISAETNGTSAVLIARGAYQTVVTFNGITLGANAPGKLFQGVAAGADPNGQFIYRTNLTSA